jgi:hypothetical protein
MWRLNIMLLIISGFCENCSREGHISYGCDITFVHVTAFSAAVPHPHHSTPIHRLAKA